MHEFGEYRPLTKKEFNAQRALGTLPLWKRIELGDVKLIEMPVHDSMCISIYNFIDGPHYYYNKNVPGSRERTIRRLINDCKEGGWED